MSIYKLTLEMIEAMVDGIINLFVARDIMTSFTVLYNTLFL